MKKAIVIWVFLFLILVLFTAQAIDSNRKELTHRFPLRFDLPFGGTYETVYAPNVIEYFGLCILLGGFVVTVLSFGAVWRSHRQAKAAGREREETDSELRRLRGPAENDEVYQSSFGADERKP